MDLPPQKCCPSNWMEAIQGNPLTGASVPSIILVRLRSTNFEIEMKLFAWYLLGISYTPNLFDLSLNLDRQKSPLELNAG